MTRKLAFLAVSLAVLPLHAKAVGLGDLELQSALNQPLHAEVALSSVTADDLLDLSVALAPHEEFAKANLKRSPLLDDLHFEVIQKPGDKAVIQVTSREPVTEPFLDFLLRINWHGGQLVREYTVLVDPPALMPAPAPQISPAVTSPGVPAPVATAIPAPAPLEATPVQSTVAPQPAQYTTAAGDNLWRIATRFLPDDSVTAGQMVMGLYRRNPDAFADGNVNRLRVGVTLDIPDKPYLVEMTPAEATADLERQEAEWQAQLSPKPEPQSAPATVSEPEPALPESVPAPATAGEAEVDEQAVETKPETEVAADTPAAEPPESGGRLKLVAPEADVDAAAVTEGVPGGPAAGTAGADEDYLSHELAVAVEAAEARRQETEALQGRLAEMQEKLDSMQKLISVNETELARLRDSWAASDAETTSEPANEGASAASVSFGAILQEVTGSPVLKSLVGVIAILVLALFWVVSRQRRMEQEMLASMADLPVRVDRQDGEDPSPDEVTDNPQASEQATNPLAEADVYIAYGRYDQAAELLAAAMKEEPQRRDLGMKLLEVYFAARNRQAFDEQALSMRQHIADGDDPDWQRIVTMGSNLSPENPLFHDADVGEGLDVVNEILEQQESETPTAEAAPFLPSEEDTGEEYDPNAIDWDIDLEATGTDDAVPGDGGGQGPASFADDSMDAGVDAAEETSWESATGWSDDDFERMPDSDAVPSSSEGEGGEDVAESMDSPIDEMDAKLDLARAYLEMEDMEGALALLEEVAAGGTEIQRQQAADLIERCGS